MPLKLQLEKSQPYCCELIIVKKNETHGKFYLSKLFFSFQSIEKKQLEIIFLSHNTMATNF